MLRTDDLDCVFTAVDHVTLEELAGEDLIAYRENSALRLRLEAKMAERGLEPRNAFVSTEMAAVRTLAGKGLGVTVIPRSAAEQDGPPIVWRPLGPEALTWPVALIWRAARRQPPAAKAFLSLALTRAEEHVASPEGPSVGLAA